MGIEMAHLKIQYRSGVKGQEKQVDEASPLNSVFIQWRW